MENIIKSSSVPQRFGVLKKDSAETVENEIKNQRCGFLQMLLGTLGISI